jgi:hypothetical protein
MERLQTAGFDGSVDAEVTGTLRIDASGQLAAVTADLAPWWLAAYRELDIPIDEIEITIELTLTALEGPLDVEAPCPTPSTECSG